MSTLAVDPVHSRATRAQIAAFLGHRRFAMIGVSRDPRDFTRSLTREFVRRNYDVVPVNPAVPEIDGKKCFACLQDVFPPVCAVLLVTPPATTEQIVHDCADAGVTDVWMYRGAGVGAVSSSAVEFCRERGMNVVAGECPYMFFPNAGFPHRVHGLVRRIVGSLPR